MSQHDYVIDNADGATVRADINSLSAAIATLNSGAAAPSTTYAYLPWADTTATSLKRRNSANTGWLVTDTLNDSKVTAKSATFNVGLSDMDTLFVCTGTSYNITFSAVATLTSRFKCAILNNGTGTLTLDPNSTEQINGATTLAIGPGDWVLVYGDGSALHATTNDAMKSQENKWAKQQYASTVVLTDQASVTWNGETQQIAEVTLGGNRVLTNITNAKKGAFYSITVKQDGTGSRTLTWNSAYLFPSGTAPILSTASSAVDEFNFKAATASTLSMVGRSLDVK